MEKHSRLALGLEEEESAATNNNYYDKQTLERASRYRATYTGPGAPRKHITTTITSVSMDLGVLMDLRDVAREIGRSVSEIFQEMSVEYVKRFRSKQNPGLDAFLPEEERPTHAPITLADSAEDASLKMDTLSTVEIRNVQKSLKVLRRMAKHKLEAVTDSISRRERQEQRDKREREEKERKTAELLKQSQRPDNLELDASRIARLKELWGYLQRPDHDQKGGQVCRVRRLGVTDHIQRVQELLIVYETCHEYQEWRKLPIEDRLTEYTETLNRIRSSLEIG